MKKYCIVYTDINLLDLRVVMLELEANVKTFIEDKVNSNHYSIKDFRVFAGEELYVEKAFQRTKITLNLKYKGMS